MIAYARASKMRVIFEAARQCNNWKQTQKLAHFTLQYDWQKNLIYSRIKVSI